MIMEVQADSKQYFAMYRILPLIIFVEGFVSIAIEILTIRQLLPVAGGSVIVTSLIIGIFLLFLALGYRQGGNQQQNLPYLLRRNFFIVAIWLGIGLSYIFIYTFFYCIQKVSGLHIVYPLLTYLLLVIAPLIYLLGQTVPITMNMIKQNRPAGSIGGNALGISTLGSFLGAILTTLVFMYFFGVAWTVFFNFILLILLSLVLTSNKTSLLVHSIFTAVAIFIVYAFNIKIENLTFDLTNQYANYQVVSGKNYQLQNDAKMLIINEAASSMIDKNNKGFQYAELVKKILFDDLKLRDADILVLGAGGFSISAENTFGNHITYIDVDKQIKKVTVPKFIPKLNSDLIIYDARHYLNVTDKKYQAILADAYSDIKSVPAHLITREYIMKIREHLREDGVAIFNMLGNPMLSDSYSKRIDNTIKSVFPNCMAIPIRYSNRVTNILYACSNTVTHQYDRVVYSDNLNNSTTDSFSW